MNRLDNSRFKMLVFLAVMLLVPASALKAQGKKKDKQALANRTLKLKRQKKNQDSNSASGSKKLDKRAMSVRERVRKTLEFAKRQEQQERDERARKITRNVIRTYQPSKDANRKLRLLNPRRDPAETYVMPPEDSKSQNSKSVLVMAPSNSKSSKAGGKKVLVMAPEKSKRKKKDKVWVMPPEDNRSKAKKKNRPKYRLFQFQSQENDNNQKKKKKKKK